MNCADYDSRYAIGRPITPRHDTALEDKADIVIVRIPHPDGKRWIDYPIDASMVRVVKR